MAAGLSIVIPTLNASAALPQALMPLVAGVADGVVRELVVSDGGSTDDTAEIARGVGAVLVSGAGGRGGQLRRGAEAATGAWLLFLHADTWLEEDWHRAVALHMQNETRAGYFQLRFRAEGLIPRLVAAWANARSRWFGLPYGDQGLLISRQMYDAAGGFADIPLMEDVAMARALRGQLVALPVGAATSAERYEREGWLRRGARNLGTLALYFAGRSPERLARRYAGSD